MARTIRALIILLAIFAYKSYGQSTYPEVRVTYRYGTDSVVVYPDSIVFKSGGVRSTLINRFKAYADTVRAGVALFAPSLTLSNLTVDAAPDSALTVVDGLVKMAAWPTSSTPAAVDSARWLKHGLINKYFPGDSLAVASRADTIAGKWLFQDTLFMATLKPIRFGTASIKDTLGYKLKMFMTSIDSLGLKDSVLAYMSGTKKVVSLDSLFFNNKTVNITRNSNGFTCGSQGMTANNTTISGGNFYSSNSGVIIRVWSSQANKIIFLASDDSTVAQGWAVNTISGRNKQTGGWWKADTLIGNKEVRGDTVKAVKGFSIAGCMITNIDTTAALSTTITFSNGRTVTFTSTKGP